MTRDGHPRKTKTAGDGAQRSLQAIDTETGEITERPLTISGGTATRIPLDTSSMTPPDPPPSHIETIEDRISIRDARSAMISIRIAGQFWAPGYLVTVEPQTLHVTLPATIVPNVAKSSDPAT
jgi:hypothetical protein